MGTGRGVPRCRRVDAKGRPDSATRITARVCVPSTCTLTLGKTPPRPVHPNRNHSIAGASGQHQESSRAGPAPLRLGGSNWSPAQVEAGRELSRGSDPGGRIAFRNSAHHTSAAGPARCCSETQADAPRGRACRRGSRSFGQPPGPWSVVAMLAAVGSRPFPGWSCPAPAPSRIVGKAHSTRSGDALVERDASRARCRQVQALPHRFPRPAAREARGPRANPAGRVERRLHQPVVTPPPPASSAPDPGVRPKRGIPYPQACSYSLSNLRPHVE